MGNALGTDEKFDGLAALREPQGWSCPKCGKVYAPWVWECHGCNSGIPAYQPGNTDYPFPGSDPTTNPPGIGEQIPLPYEVMISGSLPVDLGTFQVVGMVG